MSVDFLRQVAATPLPKSFNDAKDVDAVRILHWWTNRRKAAPGFLRSQTRDVPNFCAFTTQTNAHLEAQAIAHGCTWPHGELAQPSRERGRRADAAPKDDQP
jgi:hypothetical protein